MAWGMPLNYGSGSLTDHLKSTGALWLPTDPTFLWWKHADGRLRGLVCLHVDDIYWTRDKSFVTGVVQALRDKFPIGKESDWEFGYLGLLVKPELDDQKKMFITVSQRHYEEKVGAIDVQGTKKQDQSLANKVQHDAYMELVGKLLWLTGQRRPDISFLVMCLAQKCSKPWVADLHQANSVLKRAQRDDVYLK